MTGSLQIKNGKYYAVINLVDSDGKRKQKWISTNLLVKGNKKNAEKFLRDVLKDYEIKYTSNYSDILFSDYVIHWLEVSKIKLDPITYQGYKELAYSHIIPYFKERNILLQDITRNDIQEYVNIKFENGRLDGKGGLSPKTIKTHLIIIQQTIKEAIRSDLLLNNPCLLVKLPKAKKYEPNFYTINQLNDLFTAINDEPLYPLIYFTVLFGLRRSEVLGLKWDSVDFENHTLTIKHTVVRYYDVFEKDSTKSKSSFRSFPIPDTAFNMLLDLKVKENENRKICGKDYIENNYIFKWKNGQTYSPDFITNKFNKILKQYDLPHIRFHDLRHSCASLLVSNGFTLKDIQEWLGHADIQTTANVYAHLDVERKNKIAFSVADSLNV